MRVRIILRNSGGPLDTQYAETDPVKDDERGDNPIKDKLNEMLDGIDLASGDTIIIEEA